MPTHTEALRETVARAIWNVQCEYEDRCDMELEDMGPDHHVWQVADAAIAALPAPHPSGRGKQSDEYDPTGDRHTLLQGWYEQKETPLVRAA